MTEVFTAPVCSLEGCEQRRYCRGLCIKSHPLATAQGKLLEHRAVLYSRLGPGSHDCHWCGAGLVWRGRAERRINADHLDHNKLNNDPANLVPSCLDCNTKRRRAA